MLKYAIVGIISFAITFLYMKSKNGRIDHSVVLGTSVASAVGSIFAVVVAGLYDSQKSQMITGTSPIGR